jgi:hypothetical protein
VTEIARGKKARESAPREKSLSGKRPDKLVDERPKGKALEKILRP